MEFVCFVLQWKNDQLERSTVVLSMKEISFVALQGNTQERMVSHIQKAFSIVPFFVRDNSVNSLTALAVLISTYWTKIVMKQSTYWPPMTAEAC